MSYQEYKQSQEIESRGYDFYALIMAAMRKADSHNIHKLMLAFPVVHKEVCDRYNMPGGKYVSERSAEGHSDAL